MFSIDFSFLRNISAVIIRIGKSKIRNTRSLFATNDLIIRNAGVGLLNQSLSNIRIKAMRKNPVMLAIYTINLFGEEKADAIFKYSLVERITMIPKINKNDWNDNTIDPIIMNRNMLPVKTLCQKLLIAAILKR